MTISGIEQVRGHTFFGSCIDDHSLVVDLGANDGRFAIEIAERFVARCIAVEASPVLFDRFPKHPRVQVLNLAIAGQDTTLQFNLSQNPEASSLYRGAAVAVPGAGGGIGTVAQIEVRGCRFETLMAQNQVDHIDLLKVDIEGAEVDLFATTCDQTLKRIQQITIEFHDFCGLISVKDVLAIRRRLERLGFYGIPFARTNGDWLFVQPHLCGIGSIRLRFAKYIVGNAMGLGRIMRRRLRRRTSY